MLFSYIMSVLLATQFAILSPDTILVCGYDTYGHGISQIWTVNGTTITKSPKFVCSTERNLKPISVKATSKNTFDLNYGNTTIKGIISGRTVTYLDFK